MVSRHGMVWQRPGMNCSPAAEIHVKRADGESPHPLLTTGPLMQELHGSRGETFMLDLSTSLKASSPPLSAKKSPSSSTWIGCRLRIHTVRERSMAGCPYSYNGLQKRLKSPLLVQCQAANSLRLAAGFNPGRQHTDMDSILHIHPQFRRSIPGIRAHDKSVLDREHALRISAQTSSSLLEGTSTSAQRWCTYRVYVSLPSRSIRLWMSTVVNALASPSRVGSIGLSVPRLPSIACGKSHMGHRRNAAPRRMVGWAA